MICTQCHEEKEIGLVWKKSKSDEDGQFFCVECRPVPYPNPRYSNLSREFFPGGTAPYKNNPYH